MDLQLTQTILIQIIINIKDVTKKQDKKQNQI